MTKREYYLFVRVCPICAKEKLYENEKICPSCEEKHRQRCRERYRENRETEIKKMSARGKNRYQERIEQGLCTRCGKLKAAYGKRKCPKCQLKENEYAMLRRSS